MEKSRLLDQDSPRLFSLMMLVMVIMVTACGASSDGSYPAVGEPCSSDGRGGCSSNAWCIEGSCHLLCEQDSSCSSQTCVYVPHFGICLLPNEASCKQDSDCTVAYQGRCFSGRCRNGCFDDDDCLETQNCIANACVTKQVWEADCTAACAGRVCGRSPRVECSSITCGTGTCSSGELCTSMGICTKTLEPSSKWIVQATRGTVSNQSNWEAICEPKYCPPDPYLSINYHSTTKVQDTYNPVWNYDVITLTAAELMSGVDVSYLDDDNPWSNDDIICNSQLVKFSADDFSKGTKSIVCSNGTYSFALWPSL